MINFSNTTFIKSTPTIKEKPSCALPEVLLVGKSNVGKSSLINALVRQNRLAFTSSKPGHTKLLNYFNVDNKLLLVDAPGYGYAVGGLDLDTLFGQMMSEYFEDNNELKLALLLIDSRREAGDHDLEILEYFESYHIPFLVVCTKMDKLNQKEKSLLYKRMETVGVPKDKIFLVSKNDIKSLDNLKGAIEKSL